MTFEFNNYIQFFLLNVIFLYFHLIFFFIEFFSVEFFFFQIFTFKFLHSNFYIHIFIFKFLHSNFYIQIFISKFLYSKLTFRFLHLNNIQFFYNEINIHIFFVYTIASNNQMEMRLKYHCQQPIIIIIITITITDVISECIPILEIFFIRLEKVNLCILLHL